MREIVREDDGALLGYVGRVEGGWRPMTVFGYPLGPAAGEDAAATRATSTRSRCPGRGLASCGP